MTFVKIQYYEYSIFDQFFQMIKQKQQGNTITLKGSVFSYSQILVKLINQNVKLKQLLQSNIWEQTLWSQRRKPLVKSQFVQHWQPIFLNCIETQVEQIFFKCLFLDCNILEVSQQTKFKNLKSLCLQQLHLYDIYPIQFLNAYNLQQLSLNTNRISDVKALKKTNFRKLKYLYLFINPIKNIEHICQMALQLTQSLVVQNNQMEGSVIGQDISYMFKLQPKKLNNYGTFLCWRIQQKKLKQMLKNRYNKTNSQ